MPKTCSRNPRDPGMSWLMTTHPQSEDAMCTACQSSLLLEQRCAKLCPLCSRGFPLGSKGGAFPIWTCHSFVVLFFPLWDLPDFPEFSRFFRDFPDLSGAPLSRCISSLISTYEGRWRPLIYVAVAPGFYSTK